MTDDEARALGARLAALRAHRRGMTILLAESDADTGFPTGKRGVISSVAPSGEIAYVRWDDGSLDDCDYLTRYLLPDLRDPATRGAALDVVRERWGGTVWIGGRLTAQRRLAWWVCGLHRSDEARVNGEHGFGSEQEALVVALEAVP